MGSRTAWITVAAAALLFTLQLSAQNPTNPLEVSLLR
jgi:hypothetical protein